MYQYVIQIYKLTIEAYFKCSKFASDLISRLVTLVRFKSVFYSTYSSCIFMYII